MKANLHISCSCLGVLSFWRRSGVSPHRSGTGPGPHPGGSTPDPDPHRTHRTLSCRTQKLTVRAYILLLCYSYFGKLTTSFLTKETFASHITYVIYMTQRLFNIYKGVLV